MWEALQTPLNGPTFPKKHSLIRAWGWGNKKKLYFLTHLVNISSIATFPCLYNHYMTSFARLPLLIFSTNHLLPLGQVGHSQLHFLLSNCILTTRKFTYFLFQLVCLFVTFPTGKTKRDYRKMSYLILASSICFVLLDQEKSLDSSRGKNMKNLIEENYQRKCIYEAWKR